MPAADGTTDFSVLQNELIGSSTKTVLDGTKWNGLYVGRRKGPDLVYAGNVDRGAPPSP